MICISASSTDLNIYVRESLEKHCFIYFVMVSELYSYTPNILNHG